MRMDIKPGRIVEHGDYKYLIEKVEVTVVMQRIEPLSPKLAKTDGTPQNYFPVFVKLTGDPDDPDSTVSQIIPLYKEDEL